MSKLVDFYQVLDVSYYATSEEIKAAYRKKVHEFHPDKETGNIELFKLVQEAYDVLKNEEKRKRYNDILFNSSNVAVVSTASKHSHDIPKEKKSTTQGKNKWKIVSLISLFINVIFITLGLWEYSSLTEQTKTLTSDNVLLQEEKGYTLKQNTELRNLNNELKSEITDLYTINEELINSQTNIVVETPIQEEYEDAFTEGSSKEHVKKIMGTPTSLTNGGDTWWYTNSAWVSFNEEDKVDGWYDYNGQLKVR